MTPQLSYTGERAIPWRGATGVRVMAHHIARYAWAFPFCWQKRVADLGCGAGYGAYMLSWGAREVVGMDIDAGAVAFARHHFGRPDNISFERGDMTLMIPPADVYVAFESLEHVTMPRAIINATFGSTLLFSMPVGDDSRYHTRAYSASDIVDLVGHGAEYWYQYHDGRIVPEDEAQYEPAYLVGVRR